MAHFVCNAANMLKVLAFAAAIDVISPFLVSVILAIQNLVFNNRFPANLPILVNSFLNSTLLTLDIEFSLIPDIIKAFTAPLPEEIAKQNPPALPLDPASELPYSDAVYALTNPLNTLQTLISSGSTNNRDSGWVAKCIMRSGYLISNVCNSRKEMEIIHKGLAMEDEFLFIGVREK